jgi:hypothetical protein
MGGPWRDRRFDPTTWQIPAPRVEGRRESAAAERDDHITAIVIGYVASVLTSVAIVLTFLKSGW